MHLTILQACKFDYEIVKANNPDHYFKAVHSYRFNVDEENRYLVMVEEYQNHVFILKFCLEKNQDDTDKFNVLLNIGYTKAKKVLLTCVQIALSIYEKNSLASFGFIASPTPDELRTTGFHSTKRLSVYKYFIEYYSKPENFKHSYSEENSSYLLLNKNYEKQEPDALQKIKAMLALNLASAVRIS